MSDSAPSPAALDHAAATAVKASLLARLAGDERLRGVGVSRDAGSGGFQVEVRCADPSHVAELGLPSTVDGVPVRVRAVGEVTASCDQPPPPAPAVGPPGYHGGTLVPPPGSRPGGSS